MNDTSKNLEQKIDTINSALQLAQEKFVIQDTALMIFSGWTGSAFFLYFYLTKILADYLPIPSQFDFLLTFLPLSIGVGFIIFYVDKLFSGPYANSFISKARGRITGGFIISITVFNICMNMIYGASYSELPDFLLPTIMFCTVYGGMFFINSQLGGDKRFAWCGVFFLIAALLSAYVQKHQIPWIDWTLMMALLLLFGLALPGNIIKYKLRHEKPQTP